MCCMLHAAGLCLRCDTDNGCLTVVPRSHQQKVHYSHFKSDDPSLVLNQVRALITLMSCLIVFIRAVSCCPIMPCRISSIRDDTRAEAGFLVDLAESTQQCAACSVHARRTHRVPCNMQHVIM